MFQITAAKQHHHQSKTDINQQATHRSARPRRDLATSAPEYPHRYFCRYRTRRNETKTGRRISDKKWFGLFFHRLCACIPKQRQIIAMLVFPVVDCLLGDMLLPQLHTRHIIRAVDDEKQHKSQNIHAHQQGNAYKNRLII